MKKIITIIPARMGSSRFPGKPMMKIFNEPMIGMVYRRVSNTPGIALTVVATCDKEIFNYIESIGGKAVYTSESHERASDRCAEALLQIEEELNCKFDIVVMVQGDEPMTRPDMLMEAISPMVNDESIKVVNLFSEIDSRKEFNNPNCIKVTLSKDNNALYFSRSPIPYSKLFGSQSVFKQVCVIPFTREFLLEYNRMEPTVLEIAESVDMMRVLENDLKVKMVYTKHKTHAVDRLSDIEIVENMIMSEKLD